MSNELQDIVRVSKQELAVGTHKKTQICIILPLKDASQRSDNKSELCTGCILIKLPTTVVTGIS